MKTTKLLTFLLVGVSVVSFAGVATGEEGTGKTETRSELTRTGAAYTAIAENLAKNNSVSPERICLAVADAVKNDDISPAEVFSRVVAARETWSATQVAALYKSVLMASPALSQSFVSDVEAFCEAGKPTVVSADASEGVKLLASLYAAQIPGVDADSVISSIVAGATGAVVPRSVAPLRDVAAKTSSSLRRPQPTKPTPPVTSPEN